MHICSSVTQNTCSVHTCRGCAGVQRRLLKMMSQSLVCLNRGFPQRETGHICPADIHISVDKIKYAAARWKEGHMPFSLSHFSRWDTPASHAHALARVHVANHPWFVPVLTHTHRSDGHAWPVFTLNKVHRDRTQTNKQRPSLASNTLFLIGFHSQQTSRFHQNVELSWDGKPPIEDWVCVFQSFRLWSELKLCFVFTLILLTFTCSSFPSSSFIHQCTIKNNSEASIHVSVAGKTIEERLTQTNIIHPGQYPKMANYIEQLAG